MRITPKELKGMNEKEIRSEYSRLRSIANKRLGRLEQADLSMYKKGMRFPKIKDVGDISKLKEYLLEVSKFTATKETTVKDVRKRAKQWKERMIEYGYDSLATSDQQVVKAWNYFNALREYYGNVIYKQSGDALDVLEQGERLNIPPDKLVENYDQFVEHLDELEEVKPSKNGREFSQKRLNTLFKKWKV